jgi:DNA-directed RNA polymerase subunit RPC12/RpoP
MRDPLQRGFMKGGYFAWPVRSYNCKDCGVEVETTNGGGCRCAACSKEHLKEVRKLWKRKQRGRSKKKS